MFLEQNCSIDSIDHQRPWLLVLGIYAGVAALIVGWQTQNTSRTTLLPALSLDLFIAATLLITCIALVPAYVQIRYNIIK
jgi:hypothetical protein